MDNFTTLLTTWNNYFKKLLFRHKMELAKLPKSRITRKDIKGHHYFYSWDGRKQHFVQDPTPYLRKEFLIQAIEKCENNLKHIDNLLATYEEYSLESIIACTPPKLQEFVRDSCFPIAKSNSENPLYRENLIHKTSLGTCTRSKNEAIILSQLEFHKIPYSYEKRIILNGEYFSPDISLTRPKDDVPIIWEHLGLTGDPTYLDNSFDKIKKYVRNGFVPWQNLILTFDDPNGGLDIGTVEDMIHRYIL